MTTRGARGTRWAIAWRVLALGTATALGVGLLLSQVAAAGILLLTSGDANGDWSQQGGFGLFVALTAAYVGLGLALLFAAPLLIAVAAVLAWRAQRVLADPARVVPLSTAASVAAVVVADAWVATSYGPAVTIGVLAPLGIGVALGVWVAPRAVRSAAAALGEAVAAARPGPAAVDGACQDDPGELTDTGRRGAQGPVG